MSTPASLQPNRKTSRWPILLALSWCLAWAWINFFPYLPLLTGLNALQLRLERLADPSGDTHEVRQEPTTLGQLFGTVQDLTGLDLTPKNLRGLDTVLAQVTLFNPTRKDLRLQPGPLQVLASGRLIFSGDLSQTPWVLPALKEQNTSILLKVENPAWLDYLRQGQGMELESPITWQAGPLRCSKVWRSHMTLAL
jgi:hypothetical protein